MKQQGITIIENDIEIVNGWEGVGWYAGREEWGRERVWKVGEDRQNTPNTYSDNLGTPTMGCMCGRFVLKESDSISSTKSPYLNITTAMYLL